MFLRVTALVREHGTVFLPLARGDGVLMLKGAEILLGGSARNRSGHCADLLHCLADWDGVLEVLHILHRLLCFLLSLLTALRCYLI